MANSDTTYGLFNKQTTIFKQIDDGSTPLTVFADVDEAKTYFFTTSALTTTDTNATQLQWALHNGDKELKRTIAFGTKGAGTAAGSDWADLFNAQKTALIDANDWAANGYEAEDSSEHLF